MRRFSLWVFYENNPEWTRDDVIRREVNKPEDGTGTYLRTGERDMSFSFRFERAAIEAYRKLMRLKRNRRWIHRVRLYKATREDIETYEWNGRRFIESE